MLTLVAASLFLQISSLSKSSCFLWCLFLAMTSSSSYTAWARTQSTCWVSSCSCSCFAEFILLWDPCWITPNSWIPMRKNSARHMASRTASCSPSSQTYWFHLRKLLLSSSSEHYFYFLLWLEYLRCQDLDMKINQRKLYLTNTSTLFGLQSLLLQPLDMVISHLWLLLEKCVPSY